jgi:hypothetical protein
VPIALRADIFFWKTNVIGRSYFCDRKGQTVDLSSTVGMIVVAALLRSLPLAVALSFIVDG